MRALIGLCGLLLLSACGGGGLLTTAGLVPSTANPAVRFAALEAANTPAIQIVIVNANEAGFARQEADRDGVTTWLSQLGLSFSTQDGFLVATRGMGADMLASDVNESRALVLARAPGRATRFHTFLDGRNAAVTRSYICDITVQSREKVNLFDQTLPAVVMAEDCASSDHSFRNTYFVSTTAPRILQSQQWSGARSGMLNLRVVPQ